MNALEMSAIQENLAKIEAVIERAAAKSGRARKDVTLMAVTKGVSAEKIREAQTAGLSLFGESKVQEASAKIPESPAGCQWHMIGHLQSNKVSDAVALFSMIQSVDSVRLAKAVNDAAAAQGKVVEVLLEANVTGEPKKFGFKPEEIYGAADEIATMPALRVTGLMGMTPLEGGEPEKRAAFKKLKGLFGACKSLKKENIQMKHLSMGMSDDYEWAVEEGSTLVRIGRAIFR